MSPGRNRGSEAIRVALKTEQEGLEMYQKAREKTTNSDGKKMFLALVEDEKSHVRMIKRIAEGLGMSEALQEALDGTPRERIKTIFSKARDELPREVATSTDDVEALRLALDFEKRGYEFYGRVAKDACSESEKALFESLALEENEHYAILQQTLEYLDNTGQWFLWDEQGLLDG